MRARIPECIPPLERAGIAYEDAVELRRIAMTLHNWHEQECGTDRGAIERDEKTGKPIWRNAIGTHSYTIPDREAGALKRLGKIMARYPSLKPYVQGDPRGASLYILRPGDVLEGYTADACYSRGLAVYK